MTLPEMHQPARDRITTWTYTVIAAIVGLRIAATYTVLATNEPNAYDEGKHTLVAELIVEARSGEDYEQGEVPGVWYDRSQDRFYTIYDPSNDRYWAARKLYSNLADCVAGAAIALTLIVRHYLNRCLQGPPDAVHSRSKLSTNETLWHTAKVLFGTVACILAIWFLAGLHRATPVGVAVRHEALYHSFISGGTDQVQRWLSEAPPE